MNANGWLREFWNAQDGYEYWMTRSCINAEDCRLRLLRAVDELLGMGVPRWGRMPTVDEFERGLANVGLRPTPRRPE